MQLASLKSELTGEGKSETLAELLAEVEIAFTDAAERIRVLATANLDTPGVDAASTAGREAGATFGHCDGSRDFTKRFCGRVSSSKHPVGCFRSNRCSDFERWFRLL